MRIEIIDFAKLSSMKVGMQKETFFPEKYEELSSLIIDTE